MAANQQPHKQVAAAEVEAHRLGKTVQLMAATAAQEQMSQPSSAAPHYSTAQAVAAYRKQQQVAQQATPQAAMAARQQVKALTQQPQTTDAAVAAVMRLRRAREPMVSST